MSSLILSGETSGTVTLQAATVSGNTVITLPSSTGTLLSSGVNTYNAVQTFTADNIFSGNNAFSGITTFTNTVVGITKTMVGLTNIDNTSDTAKPISILTQAALDLKAPQSTTYNKTETDSRIQAIVDAAPLALDTLVEIAAQLASDESAAAALTTAVSLKASIASPTFTGTVSGITKAMVGLDSVDNTTDLLKPVSTATTTAIGVETTRATNAESTKVDKVTGKGLSTEDYTSAEKAKLAAVTGANTGDETLETIKSKLGITTLSGSNTGDQDIPTTLPASDVSAWAKSATKPTYTATEVGLGLVNNTTDAAKPVSIATQTALDLKANQTTTYTKTETDSRIQTVIGAAPLALDTLVEIAAQLASDESAAAALVTVVSGKVDKVTGKSLSAEDFSTAEKAKLAAVTGSNTGDETLATIKTKLGITTLSGSNTGDQYIPTTLPASDVSAWAKAATKPSYTPTEISLGNVDNTSDVNKPISTATQTALNLKATLNGINAFTLLNTFNTLSFVAIDKGNSGVSTQTFDYSAGGHQKLTITGATTIAFSNFPTTGRGELLVELVNGSAFTITWPSINFMKPDGTFTTSIATYLAANTGRTALKASGADFLLLFSSNAGTTIYGKLI